MRLHAFAVLDDKAGCFAHPFFALAPGQAMRMFEDWCKDANTPLAKHPEDYVLYGIGAFDDSTGVFEVVEKPVFLVRGSDVVASGERKLSVS